MTIEINDTWSKFWQEVVLAEYEGTNPKNKYVPPYKISKIMARYEIKEIKPHEKSKDATENKDSQRPHGLQDSGKFY